MKRQRSGPCFPASDCSTSPSSACLERACSGKSSSIRTEDRCSPGTGPTPDGSPTCATLALDSLIASTESSGDSPVAAHPAQASAMDLHMPNRACGESTPGSSASSARHGRSSRTRSASSDADSILCSPTSTRWTCTHVEVDLRPPTSGHRTAANGCGSWPTPTRTDGNDSARHTTTTGVMHSGTMMLDAVRALTGRRDLPPMLQSGQPGSPAIPVVNPRFVEALLGAPDQWTAVVDDNDSSLLAIASAYPKPRRR